MGWPFGFVENPADQNCQSKLSTLANLCKNNALKPSGPVALPTFRRAINLCTCLLRIGNHSGIAFPTEPKNCSCTSAGSLHFSAQHFAKALALATGVLCQLPSASLSGGKKEGAACLLSNCLLNANHLFDDLGRASILTLSSATYFWRSAVSTCRQSAATWLSVSLFLASCLRRTVS